MPTHESVIKSGAIDQVSRARAGAARRAVHLSLLAAIALLAPPFAAPVRAQYRFDTRSTDHGLPQNSVHAILQTRDGYLWFTTFDGLVRYDGVRFTIYDRGSTPGIVSNRFDSLYEAADGSLWAGTENGGVTRYKDGSFRTYTTADGLPDDRVSAVCDDGEGGLLMWTLGGVVRWREGRFSPHPALSESKAVRRSNVIHRDRSGTIWFGNGKELGRLREGVVTFYTADAGLDGTPISTVFEDRQGRIWVGTYQGLYRYEDERFAAQFTRGKTLPAPVMSMCEDRRGDFWLAMDGGGLARLSGDVMTVFTTADGLPSNRVVSVYEDREGSLWFGTSNHGLTHVRREAVRFLSQENGLSGSNVYPIFEDAGGGVWVGTWDGGLSRYADGRFNSFRDHRGFPQNLITSLKQDRAGRLWVGLYRGIGRIEGETFVNLTEELDPDKQPVLVIHEDRGGTLWLGTKGGLYCYAGGALKHYTTADGLAGDDVKDILEDQGGDLWFATYGGLSRFHEGRFINYTTRDGLASDSVRTLYEDAERTLWIGTYDGGLSRFREGRFVNYTTADGLFSNGVFRILEDHGGNFWMSCNRGIYRVSRAQLEDFAAGRLRHIVSFPYGSEDGLVHTECNGGQQPAGIRTRDGKFWFPTQGGVAVIDPDEIETNPLPPPVVIEEATIDREPAAVNSTLRIEPGRENLEIRYTGLSFINPEHVTFRYRIDGIDADWVEAGTRRTAHYAHLPPGSYVFHVIAANGDGVWNNAGATLRLVVVPPFWRTWWFTALLCFAVAGLAYTFYRRRLARLHRANAAQRAFSQQLIELQEGERKRIAAGLHDSLGQNLLIIKNRALLGLQTPEDEASTHTQLEEISSISSQTLEEVREIAYNLHPYHMDRLGLTKAIQAMLRKVAAASEIEFSTEIDKIDGLFQKDSEINIYRIVQESVNNIVKHSGAKRAHVAVRRDRASVLIVVSDDGKGFSPEAVASASGQGTGFGLAGISERARMLGGRQVVRSTPGKGTTLTIRLRLQGDSNGH